MGIPIFEFPTSALWTISLVRTSFPLMTASWSTGSLLSDENGQLICVSMDRYTAYICAWSGILYLGASIV